MVFFMVRALLIQYLNLQLLFFYSSNGLLEINFWSINLLIRLIGHVWNLINDVSFNCVKKLLLIFERWINTA